MVTKKNKKMDEAFKVVSGFEPSKANKTRDNRFNVTNWEFATGQPPRVKKHKK